MYLVPLVMQHRTSRLSVLKIRIPVREKRGRLGLSTRNAVEVGMVMDESFRGGREGGRADGTEDTTLQGLRWPCQGVLSQTARSQPWPSPRLVLGDSGMVLEAQLERRAEGLMLPHPRRSEGLAALPACPRVTLGSGTGRAGAGRDNTTAQFIALFLLPLCYREDCARKDALAEGMGPCHPASRGPAARGWGPALLGKVPALRGKTGHCCPLSSLETSRKSSQAACQLAARSR